MKAFPRDIEVQTLKERHIGVESELGVIGDGVTVSGEFYSNLNKHGLLQSIGYDGGGREFRTTPISVKAVLKQARGRKYLEGYYLELRHHTTVLDSGGTHIHISILDSDHENMEANAVAIATAFFPQFQKIAGRKSSWAGKLDLPTFSHVEQFLSRHRHNKHLYSCKGSILAPTLHKTLEFRGPRGSKDPNEVLAWIDFVNNVVNVANRKSVNGVKFGDLLKGTFISEYVKSLRGSWALSKDDLNKTLNIARLA